MAATQIALRNRATSRTACCALAGADRLNRQWRDAPRCPRLPPPARLACLALTMTLWPWGAALAQGPAPRVYTRAVVRELPAVGAQPALLRLKIVPQGKLPFSTLTFRVQDRRLLNGIGLGDEVGFIAERRPEGNTVVALRKVAPCVRFQACPPIVD